jgi:hypothetical protein
MTNTLRTTIADLATTFAIAVTRAIRGASLDDILAMTGAEAPARPGPGRPRGPAAARPKKTKGARLARRSPEDIEKALELVVALLKSTKNGLRSEQIQKHLGVQKEELPRVLKEGLATKALKSKGQKRSTTYIAA